MRLAEAHGVSQMRLTTAGALLGDPALLEHSPEFEVLGDTGLWVVRAWDREDPEDRFDRSAWRTPDATEPLVLLPGHLEPGSTTVRLDEDGPWQTRRA